MQRVFAANGQYNIQNTNMKKITTIIIASCLFSAKTFAQCDFTPAVVPDNLVLCPNSSDTLFSTETGDAYQWYKNGKPIAGATQQYHIVSSNETPSYFRVEVTRSGCTASSKKVLVDGYAFLLPYIIQDNPQLFYCPGDTAILEMGMPYNTNIQWYDAGNPIAGATNPVYNATTSGSYTACGAPEVCPNYVSCTDVPVVVNFRKPKATITERNDTLFASNASGYQWFYMRRKIDGATKNYFVPQRKGLYTVKTVDKYNCTAISNPYLFNPSTQNIIIAAPNPVQDVLHIQLLKDGVAKITVADYNGSIKIDMKPSSHNFDLPVQQLQTGTYIMNLYGNNGSLLSSVKIFKL